MEDKVGRRASLGRDSRARKGTHYRRRTRPVLRGQRSNMGVAGGTSWTAVGFGLGCPPSLKSTADATLLQHAALFFVRCQKRRFFQNGLPPLLHPSCAISSYGSTHSKKSRLTARLLVVRGLTTPRALNDGNSSSRHTVLR
jgi:hypothetical protein